MPLSDYSSVISAGFGLVGQGMSNLSTARQNRLSRKWSEKMYARQRADALADYHMQNEYNSPTAQIARMKEAGLNPALMYGGSGSVAQASDVRSSDAPRPEFAPAQWNNLGMTLRDSMLLDADLRLKDAQANQVQASATAQLEQALLTASQRENLGFDLGLKSELRDVSVDAAKEQLRQVKTAIDLSLNKDQREAALLASNLTEAVERILNMKAERLLKGASLNEIRARVRELGLSSQLKELDIKLRKEGIFPGDPLYIRFAATKAADILQSISDSLPGLKRKFEGFRLGTSLSNDVFRKLPFGIK